MSLGYYEAALPALVNDQLDLRNRFTARKKITNQLI